MDYFPAFIRLKNKKCVVVGGGSIATRKASLIVRAGGTLHVVAKKINPALTELIKESGGTQHIGKYKSDAISSAYLVVAATNDEKVNEQVSKDAHDQEVLVNVVDAPDLCSFILPAIIDRSPVMIAVSSGGQSPVLARLIRSKLETLIPVGYGRLAGLVGRYRDAVKAKYKHINERRRFWEDVLQGPIAELVFAGKESSAEEMLGNLIKSEQAATNSVGEVYLVGGGPGDPDLLTFRALRLMQQADVVLYDRLVSPEVLDLVRRDATLIYVGKARADHAVPQDQINEKLVTLAKQGHRVCRLKGGDPFIFGRGGEEIDRLADEGIPFQVVPGITAASGCASYAGIPLTHRDYSQSVRFVTGHIKEGSLDLDWDSLAKDKQTLVFYMGLVGLEHICKQLIAHGLSDTTPIALVQKGTTVDQRVLTGELNSFYDQIKGQGVVAPTIIIIGDVVRLREKLAWFS
ncbi:MAG: uroporphyrinogen-III C-methyltransferase [Pseudomonadales bacterium]|nr:uroporphyrinogen-III C-methyltransferase [Pseudomonadales bacterium]